MNYIFIIIALLLGVFPSLVHAESTASDFSSIIISEAMLNPLEDDTQWIEVYQTGDEIVDLSEWTIMNEAQEEFVLEYTISPEQYLVIPVETFFQTTDTITLINALGEIEDEWILMNEQEAGQSHVFIEDDIRITSTPTAGRMNKEQLLPLCEERNNDVQEDPEEDGEEQPVQPLESGAIILNEIFPNPLGDEIEGEFIELYNMENRSINLEQWILADASKEYLLPSVIIGPHQYLLLKRTTTSLALNNGNETITLTDPFQRIVHELSYEQAIEGKSWNYQPVDNWYAQQPTPGKLNLDPEPPQEEESEPDESPTISDEEDANQEPDAHTQVNSEEQEEDQNQTKPMVTDPNLGEIQLSELMPNPEGSDTQEWIELLNPFNETIQLRGLEVYDTAKSFVFTHQSIGPGEFYLLTREESGIALNNKNETISLSVHDEVIDTFTYETSQEAISWARFDTTWKETKEPTPEEENRYRDPEEVTETAALLESRNETSSSKQNKQEQVIPTVTLHEWELVEEGDEAFVSGVVTVLPGIMQKRIAILQSTNRQKPKAIELYFHKADWPELTLYQEITVKGEKSITQNGDRLLIRSIDDFIFGEQFQIHPIDFSLASEFVLASISGTLIEQTKKELLLDIQGDEFIISLEHDIASIPEESTVSITGITQIKGALKELLPRSAEDIQFEEKEPVVVINEEPPLPVLAATKPPMHTPLIGIGVGVVGLAMVGFVYQEKVKSFVQAAIH